MAEGTANVLSGIGGALWNWDSTPLNDVHSRNMEGKNGMVLQGYAMVGEAIASSSLVDGGMTAVADCFTACLRISPRRMHGGAEPRAALGTDEGSCSAEGGSRPGAHDRLIFPGARKCARAPSRRRIGSRSPCSDCAMM
jgi:hypothetical protein